MLLLCVRVCKAQASVVDCGVTTIRITRCRRVSLCREFFESFPNCVCGNDSHAFLCNHHVVARYKYVCCFSITSAHLSSQTSQQAHNTIAFYSTFFPTVYFLTVASYKLKQPQKSLTAAAAANQLCSFYSHSRSNR